MTFIGKDSECLPRFVGSHLHSPEVAKHFDVWPPHHQSHCHLCIGAVGLRRQWSSAWWKHQGVGLFVCKEPEENCWVSYKVLRIGGRVQATNKKSHKLGKYRRCPTKFQHQSRALFKSSPNTHSNPGVKIPKLSGKKNNICVKKLSFENQGLAWRTSRGTKAQDSSEGCPCGTWSYQQGSVGIDWGILPLPLGGHDTSGDVGTIDE